MDLNNIISCSRCGVLFDKNKCVIKKTKYLNGYKVESGQIECPVCDEIIFID